jgi:endonuclease V-like protein UPF0215 family
MTWREKYRQDPDLTESIITALRQDLKDAEKRIEMLQFALERIIDEEQCCLLVSQTVTGQIDRMKKIAR